MNIYEYIKKNSFRISYFLPDFKQRTNSSQHTNILCFEAILLLTQFSTSVWKRISEEHPYKRKEVKI